MYSKDLEISVDLNKQNVDTSVSIENKTVTADVSLTAGGGTSDHNKLKNRDMENQHPISAITDLSAKLTELDTTNADLQDKISAETLRATAKEVEIETSLTHLSDKIDTKQNILINQENIKSVNNQSLLGSGNLDIENVQNITYAELLSLKNNGELKNGLYYRITDYVTTTNGATTNSAEPSRSAGHQFDIVIQAISKNQLSEICTACLHEGDTYFANENLSGWQIWYDINNDTSKYAWADTENGKGVIYRLIDEKGNDCAYDFKNIQFYRNPTSYADISSSLTASDGYYYTFSKYISSTEIKDFSLGVGYNSNNIIGITIDLKGGEATTVDGAQKLSNNVFVLSTSAMYITRNTLRTHCFNNTICKGPIYDNEIKQVFTNNIVNGSFYMNSFEGVSNSNKILSKFYYNKINVGFNLNIIKGDFYANEIGAYFNSNTINGTFFQNSIEAYFYNNTCETSFGSNNIQVGAQNNKIGSSFGPNQIGANFKNNTVGNKFFNNTIANDCRYNTFGTQFIRCQLGNTVQYCTFGDYNRALSVGGNVVYLKTASGSATSKTYGLRFSTIKSGLMGASATNLLDLTEVPANNAYPITIEEDVNGKILATWNNLGTIKGIYKESVTATEWNDIN